MPESPADPLLGRTLDARYRIDARIGQGGMGAVYRGRHVLLDQPIAVKILRPDHTADPVAARRFAREARSCFRIDHPHSVRVTDFGGTDDGLLYLVMEYLDGRTVADELGVDGPFAPARVARVGAQVAEALAAAHALGLIHRDLKPDNVMLVRRGGDADFVKVLDFGLARIFDDAGASFATAFSVSPLTQDGVVFGTPHYMSPEQATGQPLDPGTDLYSLGVVMYEMLTGVPPFEAPSFMGLLSKHVQEVPVPPAARRPDLSIPASLDQLVMRCLAKRREERPATALDLAAALAGLAPSLARAPSRVPEAIAASATVDLAASQVAAAAPGGTVLGLAPVTPVARAREAGIPAPAPAPADRPSPGASVERGSTGAAPRSTTAASPLGAAAGRSTRLIALALVAIAIAGVTVVALSGSDDEAAPNAAPLAATEAAASARPLASMPAAAAPDSPAPVALGAAPEAVESAPDQAATPATTAPAEVDPTDAPPATGAMPDRRARSKRTTEGAAPSPAAAHLQAAEAARAAGNNLKQMAEADFALRKDPSNTRAAFLLGDALIRGGNRVDGCAYLRRARSIPQARTRSRDAGCERSGSGD